MSTSFTPGKDLLMQMKVPAPSSLFTTFSKGHFIKAGKFTQPVKAVLPVVPAQVQAAATFAGCFTEVYAADAIDLDFEEPYAVCESDLELVPAGEAVHRIEL